MTKEEFEQVFTALGLFWPRETVSDSRKAAWWLALKPYPYQGGVREKIIAYARSPKGNFFPDVANLTAGLTPEITEPEKSGPDWIDELLEKYSKGWKLSRMNKVDLTILRLGVYEMKYDEDIPERVAINEAVELAKKFGGDESPAFVNAVLAKLSSKEA